MNNLKYGVLEYRYNNNQFLPLKHELKRHGSYSVNIGDNMQSIAARMLYREIGIDNDNITTINRDDLSKYSGLPVVLIMNGCFYEPSFPIPPQIIPIFFGFNAPESVIKKNKAYFRKYEPIGCRDEETTKLFEKNGINAYTTGCLTLTFDKRLESPRTPKTFVVFGEGSGALPSKLLTHAPQDIIRDAEFIMQRMPVNVFPLGEQETNQAEQFALKMLRRYKEEAALVITPLLHAACPCMALGIPVILARTDQNSRFSAVSKLLPVYTPANFCQINWNPSVINIENIKFHMKELAKYLINEIPKKFYHINALGSIYAAGNKI
jgi:polysaccharide pyruvyl transferase